MARTPVGHDKLVGCDFYSVRTPETFRNPARWSIMVRRIYERSDAEGRLAELMMRAQTGETILIAEKGEVVARLVPASRKAATRKNETRRPVKIAAGIEAADARLERMQAQGDVPRAFRKFPKR